MDVDPVPYVLPLKKVIKNNGMVFYKVKVNGLFNPYQKIIIEESGIYYLKKYNGEIVAEITSNKEFTLTDFGLKGFCYYTLVPK